MPIISHLEFILLPRSLDVFTLAVKYEFYFLLYHHLKSAYHFQVMLKLSDLKEVNNIPPIKNKLKKKKETQHCKAVFLQLNNKFKKEVNSS